MGRKFRFWMSYTNARESNYGASLSWGNGVHTRGWDAGVKVVPRIRRLSDDGTTDADEFDVYMTRGSNGGHSDVHIGTVRDTASGPAWIPENVDSAYTDASRPPRLRRHRRKRQHAPTPTATPTAMPYDNGYSAAPVCDNTLEGSDRSEDSPGANATPAQIDSALAGPSLDSAVFGPGPVKS
jgi:hypothetical protein